MQCSFENMGEIRFWEVLSKILHSNGKAVKCTTETTLVSSGLFVSNSSQISEMQIPNRNGWRQ